MKKFIAFVLCFMLVLSMSSVAFADEATTLSARSALAYECNGSGNLRYGPGTNYEVKATFYDGEIFMALYSYTFPWFFGYAGEGSTPYKAFGAIDGYVDIQNFDPWVP